MKTRIIGGREVSAVGMGCMGLSHAYGTASYNEELVGEAVPNLFVTRYFWPPSAVSNTPRIGA